MNKGNHELVDGAVRIVRDPKPTISDSGKLLPLLPLIARGMTNRMIAEELGISFDAAKNRSVDLYRWLDAVDRANAVAIAYDRGLLVPPECHCATGSDPPGGDTV